MNENLKKGALIGIIILAVAFAGWQVTKTMNADKPHVEASYNMPAGHKSEKELALEAQAKNGGAQTAPSDPKSEADKDAALAGN